MPARRRIFHRPGPSPRRWRLLLPMLALALAVWAGGFFNYAASIPRVVEDTDRQTDAIVVLTGAGSMTSSSARMVNSIEPLAAARPGLRTTADLPLVACRS